MFASGPNYDKLKTNLRLCMSRLKLAQKKKAELAQKSRKEIADFIAIGKPDRARIRVEHIIREDYYCEAMEMIEMYCDLVLARMGLVKESQTLDSGLQESVSSLIWAGPRIATDAPEMKLVCDQLCKKYGEQYVKGVRDGAIATVNAKLMHRLSADPPARKLVESYLREIAATHGLTYEPQEVEDDEDEHGHGGGGGVGELIDMGGGQVGEPPGGPVGFRPDLMDPSAAPKAARMGPAFEPPMPEVQKPGRGGGGSGGSPFPPDVSNLDLPEIPDLPDVPRSDTGTPNGGGNSGAGSNSGGDVDFDELSRRFEELKRRQ